LEHERFTAVGRAQSNTTHDGVRMRRAAARSAQQDDRDATTISGPGALSFGGKFLRETNKDLLLFYVGSSEAGAVSGEGLAAAHVHHSSGKPDREVELHEEQQSTKGQDRAWGDEVQFTSNDTMPEAAAVVERFTGERLFIATTTFSKQRLGAGVYQTANMARDTTCCISIATGNTPRRGKLFSLGNLASADRQRRWPGVRANVHRSLSARSAARIRIAR